MIDNMIRETQVSVYCLAYNHEKYIREALEGFVKQKTNFRYEVYVHDDASTDKTADIIKEYAEKYPEIIIPVLETENQYSKGNVRVSEIVYPLLKGKYVAVCEGDDYWTDESKLQQQYDAMENNPECSICAHYADLYNVTTGKIDGYYPKMYKVQEGILNKEIELKIALLDMFQLSTCFFRKKIYDEYIQNKPHYATIYPVGDVPLWLYFCAYGSMYFIEKHMSVYRSGIEGSWTLRIRDNRSKMIIHTKAVINSLELYKDFLKHNYKEIDYAIRYTKIKKAFLEDDYRLIINKEYRDIFETFSFKIRMKCLFFGRFPELLGIYYKIKNLILGENS